MTDVIRRRRTCDQSVMTVDPSELTVMSVTRILAIINRTVQVVYENRYLT